MKLNIFKCPNCGKENNKDYFDMDLPDDFNLYHDIENENQSNGYVSFICDDCGTKYKALFVFDFIKAEIINNE